MTLSPKFVLRLCRLAPVAALVAMIGLSGCVTDNRNSNSLNSMASLPASSSATLAFDSIDGPPQDVFDSLVRTLDTEAQARKLAIVSRESPATYRLRGYYSAQVKAGQVTIAWVWDIYDRDQERQVRLSGETPAGRGTVINAWAAAKGEVLKTITRSGMDGIAGLLGSQPAPATPDAPTSDGPAIAEAPVDTGAGRTLAFGLD